LGEVHWHVLDPRDQIRFERQRKTQGESRAVGSYAERDQGARQGNVGLHRELESAPSADSSSCLAARFWPLCSWRTLMLRGASRKNSRPPEDIRRAGFACSEVGSYRPQFLRPLICAGGGDVNRERRLEINACIRSDREVVFAKNRAVNRNT
jgi:hypothetical protein